MNGENPNIIGRDDETEMLFLTLLRHEKPNALLVGEPGVGKTSMIHHIAYLIANDMAPAQLRGFQVIEINTNALLSGPGYRGTTELKFEELINNALNKGKLILFFDEFHTVTHLGEMANGQTPGLGNTLKPYLTRPDFRVIGGTTNDELKKIDDKALLRRFFKINIGEPNDEAVMSIITSCIKKYGSGLKVAKEVLPEILTLSKSMDGYNPDKCKDICDYICSLARLKGEKTIDVKSLRTFFDKYYKMHKGEDVLKEEEVIIT